MPISAQGEAASARVSDGFRWTQLVIGVVCMTMIANLQYGWTFFVPDIQKQFGWNRDAIQWAFTLFVLFETWLVPVEGWFVDKYGPRVVVVFGGVLCAAGWVINSYATTLTMFYVGQVVAGIGAGGVYGTCVGNALKWFPDKRGLAAGITAAGFGAGSALTVAPIQAMIADKGFQAAFFSFGIGQGVIVVIMAMFLLSPKTGQVPPPVVNAAVVQTRRNYSPAEVLRQPIFWLMYFMFVIVGAGGLMVTANLKPIAADLHIDKTPVTLMGVTMAAVTFAATLDRILNGLTRPFFGWVSDKIGRENTMFIAFGMEGIGIYLLYLWGHDPVWFVLLSGFVFFAWGEIYSLFPSTCTDTFGSKFAATNAGLLYTAKGTAALLVPFANAMQQSHGTWDAVFLIAAGANILASLLAIAVLKPWRAGVIRKGQAEMGPVGAAA
ncbi:oxalate/formate MFS antiporter [Prosthecomicrobium hirschii]|uniref:Spermidine/putrescine ABC transporter substrate-binding protein n=1 Tax=Prosthecodimorpha hirschii TaxID=665126 RepID=A0A0P6VR06_9HYPH|nr:oxalate/formate MFS antiporter [Prosthecomicrobium hirschii]KPL53634.1 spermidine/putrescine ABC transporter substrate-binding protein [Prosthecomicrobium hirschii]MCW1842738.1 oxalate/formate MFS antiporter [Prosthecomicrobium hirschii]TPQ44493.1 oxalate/formate MFS antiporter [Prosthecomicrobium hirschii]